MVPLKFSSQSDQPGTIQSTSKLSLIQTTKNMRQSTKSETIKMKRMTPNLKLLLTQTESVSTKAFSSFFKVKASWSRSKKLSILNISAHSRWMIALRKSQKLPCYGGSRQREKESRLIVCTDLWTEPKEQWLKMCTSEISFT